MDAFFDLKKCKRFRKRLRKKIIEIPLIIQFNRHILIYIILLSII